MNWKSYHIFIHDYTYHDIFVKDYLSNLLHSENIDNYFFIRYWQGGPHIRLRMKISDADKMKDLLVEEVKNFKEIYTTSITLNPDDFYQKQNFYGENIESEDLYWYKDLTVIEIPYIPEYNRYGGKEYISYSEKIFKESSKVVLCVLEKQPKLNKKILYSVLINKLLLNLLPNEKQEIIMKEYSVFWNNYNDISIKSEKLKEFINALISFYKISCIFNEKEIEIINKYLNEFILLKKKNEKVLEYVLFSHIHMFNNRLGIPPYLESTIADIILSMIRGGNFEMEF
ncbi:thiopeptide-type bacteriocin biosynthesis protein [Staphylococcus chromogenes]|uniref:thiopeptide-type bacteriocin biosynthesis protein n=1 Tax=Staphylococcus chromogenes TaxID=46126 RepID=UPI0028856E74|nr:thiopeptide-type bacteriocin biosynthesis protein [Staphylococcus chromogenes]MDT0716827.1 thiopeptide-type bacteriocin biosynthesis protein [Staphylococcus chromogenes]MDT0736813.1 thiopeptide-type bacteriocin biosynthesis protein [Staphylococcus chromogenes]MDT0750887.1 thiopeptide-type bacteriocin biosynthesis protein [Staphylococcus chromogenes]